MRVLIVENMPNTHFGQVSTALAEVRAVVDIVRPWRTEALPSRPETYDALVVFGGEQSALDDHAHPYIPSLAKLMRDFGDSGRPVLGICLGSQILARAYGAANLLGAAPEFGWHRVTLTAEAADDPVLASVPHSFPIFQWHSDTFTLPDGAIRLASNAAVENQCFRIGRAAYGMQFHFEANREVVEKWNAEFSAALDRKHPDWLPNYAATAELHGPDADAAGLAIARAWVALIPADRPAETMEIS
jgi:GMP synthase-like glutamine amidotransferase